MEMAMSVLSMPEGSTRAWGNTVGYATGFLRRVFEAAMRSRARRVNEDIARYLQHSGGRLTDEVEREMMQLLTRNWNLRP
jgi:hypothetical protein